MLKGLPGADGQVPWLAHHINYRFTLEYEKPFFVSGDKKEQMKFYDEYKFKVDLFDPNEYMAVTHDLDRLITVGPKNKLLEH